MEVTHDVISFLWCTNLSVSYSFPVHPSLYHIIFTLVLVLSTIIKKDFYRPWYYFTGVLFSKHESELELSFGETADISTRLKLQISQHMSVINWNSVPPGFWRCDRVFELVQMKTKPNNLLSWKQKIPGFWHYWNFCTGVRKDTVICTGKPKYLLETPSERHRNTILDYNLWTVTYMSWCSYRNIWRYS